MLIDLKVPEGEMNYVTAYVYGDGAVFVSDRFGYGNAHEPVHRVADAISIPKQHGPYIDAKELLSDVNNFVECMTNAGADITAEMLWGKFMDALENAKPIIPEK